MSAHGSTRAVYFAFAGNLLIAVIKFFVSIITGSAAMLAEAIHSTADTFNQVFLLIGVKRSTKSASEIHSFGYSRETFFWSLMVAVLLFFVGALFSVYEGVHKLLKPEAIENVYWIFLVIIVSIAIEAKSFHVAYTEFGKKHPRSMLKAIKDSTDVNLIVVLLEDSAALAGLIFVLISVALAHFVDPVFDAIGSIGVGVILLAVSILLIAEVKKLIIGESMPREKRQIIKDIIADIPHIERINRFQTMVTGNNTYLVLLSVDMDDEIKVYDAEDIIEKTKRKITNNVQGIENIYIEIKDAVRNQQF
jgi:cation diffusion facilitator family transporter